MEVRALYKHKRPDGGTTIFTEIPNVPYTTMYRIIADAGMAVTRDGIRLYAVVDTDTADGWYECAALTPVEASPSQSPVDQNAAIAAIQDEEFLVVLVATNINSIPVDNATALRWRVLYPSWIPGITYATGDKVQFENKLYRCLQNHTSEAAWTPEAAPSLFAKVLIPDETVVPDWEQPGSTNGYMTGDKVTYNGKIYESLIDSNVWSPDAHPAGWREVENN